ncbi:hypothetical protein GT347_20570 [Xylophilus rhododendri]|uniref:Fucosyltransferase C-terminal domain-containing protein n=1 Tax=Xylophilus rhododendri TaxID=2697032 RepID=A0A857JAT2_9BURK|nr:glycosyltransferase family 10 [Xylophilus rhododendri]QHJ00160.1 hypothetical protein GT347_20570 [Xylophilus rhododendri]
MSTSIYIDPSYPSFLDGQLFNAQNSVLNRDDQLLPFIRVKEMLESRNVRVATADHIVDHSSSISGLDKPKYYSLGIASRFESIEKEGLAELDAFVIMEPPIVAPHLYKMLPRLSAVFNRVYLHNTVGDGYSMEGVNAGTLRKFYWPLPYDGVLSQHWSRSDRLPRAVVINGNHKAWGKPNELYSTRISAMVELSKFDCIDLYGMGWSKWWDRRSLWPAYFLNRRALMKIYKGHCASKYEVLAAYDFCLCLENMHMQGYITEKIFDCFFSGAIPMYAGAPDIANYIPSDCFIDRRHFASWTDMWRFASALSAKEKCVYRENAKNFLESERATPFFQSIDNVVCGWHK